MVVSYGRFSCGAHPSEPHEQTAVQQNLEVSDRGPKDLTNSIWHIIYSIWYMDVIYIYMVGCRWYIHTKILQNMVSGIPPGLLARL